MIWLIGTLLVNGSIPVELTTMQTQRPAYVTPISLRCIQRTESDYMTGRGTVNIAIRLLGGCIVLAYGVIAWGIL